VSVVIPTRGRPDLVQRAVRSALDQTGVALEVVVIVDGPNRATSEALSGIADPRLRVVTSAAPAGGAVARNRGVSEASGEWIAFLDDDDEWLPGKLAAQLVAARLSAVRWPVVACRVLARTPRGEFVWPRFLPSSGENVGEYLFSRRGPFRGDGLVQTSMLLAPRELLRLVPFRPDLPRIQETDWVLRVTARQDVELCFVPDALSVWYTEEKRESISSSADWRETLAWIREVRPLVTSRAYADFLLVNVAVQAAAQGDRRALVELAREAFRSGPPGFWAGVLFASLWVVPPEIRRAVRARVSRSRR
jgi:glycosyltransferase involved in cell wall biosynthesis